MTSAWDEFLLLHASNDVSGNLVKELDKLFTAPGHCAIPGGVALVVLDAQGSLALLGLQQELDGLRVAGSGQLVQRRVAPAPVAPGRDRGPSFLGLHQGPDDIDRNEFPQGRRQVQGSVARLRGVEGQRPSLWSPQDDPGCLVVLADDGLLEGILPAARMAQQRCPPFRHAEDGKECIAGPATGGHLDWGLVGLCLHTEAQPPLRRLQQHLDQACAAAVDCAVEDFPALVVPGGEEGADVDVPDAQVSEDLGQAADRGPVEDGPPVALTPVVEDALPDGLRVEQVQDLIDGALLAGVDDDVSKATNNDKWLVVSCWCDHIRRKPQVRFWKVNSDLGGAKFPPSIVSTLNLKLEPLVALSCQRVAC